MCVESCDCCGTKCCCSCGTDLETGNCCRCYLFENCCCSSTTEKEHDYEHEEDYNSENKDGDEEADSSSSGCCVCFNCCGGGGKKQSYLECLIKDLMTCFCCCFSLGSKKRMKQEMEFFRFTMGLKERYRFMLNDSLSMERGDTGDFGVVVTIIDAMADKADSFIHCATCETIEKSCSHCVDPLVLQMAQSAAIVEELDEAGVDFGTLPRTKMMCKLLVKTYYADIFGIPAFGGSFTETKFEDDQIRTIAHKYAALRDLKGAEKIIRILKVGSCDYQVEPNAGYRLLQAIPGFTFCYGGSYSQGVRLANYMMDVGIEYDDLVKVIEDKKTYKKHWKGYMKEFVERAVIENRDEIHRMASGDKVDHHIKESVKAFKKLLGDDFDPQQDFVQNSPMRQRYSDKLSGKFSGKYSPMNRNTSSTSDVVETEMTTNPAASPKSDRSSRKFPKRKHDL